MERYFWPLMVCRWLKYETEIFLFQRGSFCFFVLKVFVFAVWLPDVFIGFVMWDFVAAEQFICRVRSMFDFGIQLQSQFVI